ncbi:uncharacterized protein LOC115622804 [Scaptodrosophila lebanonensis]|uniref:Uncharacterized protein LOC115622804 n=1 Tax=Drosophila lebanonensis TaxID=7225 RepID=A0A6J2TCM4_DROLE|nr:uncharacterized protein LOC115622804 [Scaptodrosophila lebanonensis]
MRVRDKRKQQQKEAKSQNETSKTPPPAKNKLREDIMTPPPAPPTTPTLPAAEKVAFDNRIKRKNVLALNEKVAALREYDRQPVYKHVGRMFNCSPDQIKRIVTQRGEILQAWEQRTRRSQDARTREMKVVRCSMLGRAVYEWIRRMMYYKDFSITDGLIQKMALQFKSSMGLNNFFPHPDWCDKLRQTYDIQKTDTKLLKIGYTQGFSVQIKDIVNDIMTECSQDATNGATDGGIIDDEEDERHSRSGVDASATTNGSVSSRAGNGDVEDDVDIDGGGSSEHEDEDVKPSLHKLNLALQQKLPLSSLVGLPLTSLTPPGTSQKVLLATPILPSGTPSTGAQPMTMTIIPLATLAQSMTQHPSSKAGAQELTTPVSQVPGKVPTLPPPMLDIKKEIKTEPLDEAESLPVQAQPVPSKSPSVRIKEEVESDLECEDFGEGCDDEDDFNGGRSSVTSLAEVLAANVEDEKEYIEHTRAMRKRKFSLTSEVEMDSRLPPLPVLTKAPTPPKRIMKRRHDDNNNAGSADPADHQSQSVISCAEARKYLKLLEEFALHKENYRLIELITRADEVMRELDDNDSA